MPEKIPLFTHLCTIVVEVGLTYCWRKASEDFESKILEDNVLDFENLKIKDGGTASAKKFSEKKPSGDKEKFDRVKW